MQYLIDIEEGYVPSNQPFETNEGYVQFVMSMASVSYKNQYQTASQEAGITAAREAYNAALPVPAPEPEPVPEPVEG